MSMMNLTEGGYVFNHYLAVLWCTGAGLYSYIVCIIDLVNAIKVKKGGKHTLEY